MERIAADLRIASVLAELAAARGNRIATTSICCGACLLVAQLDGEEIDVEEYVRSVDHMAGEIQAQLAEKADEPAKLAALNKYLFEENGFHGSRTDYYNRANSYLSRVLDDREGLPITLSVLYMELARRLDDEGRGHRPAGPLRGACTSPRGSTQLIDPFESGKLLSREEADQRRSANSRNARLAEDDLTPPTDLAILLRVLTNLLGVAQRKTDREAMLRYLDAMLAVDPALSRERGMRAMVRFETGRKTAAVSDLDWFIAEKPEGVDLPKVNELREFFLQGKESGIRFP